MFQLSFSLTVFLFFVQQTTSRAPTATATFGSPLQGSIIVSEGEVKVDLDFSRAIYNFPDIFTRECFEGGLQYHIHTKYENLDESSAIGGDCGPANLGGHYDPFLACGPATGNPLCANIGGCVERTYNCEFENDPFSCEIGDWSAKYGLLKSKDTRYKAKSSSFFEISPVDLIDRGVVIHCNDGRRIACASWDVELGFETKPQQPTEKIAEIDFSDALEGENEITLYPDGTYEVEFAFNDAVYEKLFEKCGFKSLEYYIFKEWNGKDEAIFGNDQCLYATGGSTYDPTASCLPFSSNENCVDGATCGELDYDCSESTGYSCSPSDLSGRLGSVSLGRRRTSFCFHGTDYFLPPIDDIIGRSVGVVCGDELLFCGEIQRKNQSGGRRGSQDSRRGSRS